MSNASDIDRENTRPTSPLTRFRCTYCEAQIPWSIDPKELGCTGQERPSPGRIYPYTSCPCGYGNFVTCEASGVGDAVTAAKETHQRPSGTAEKVAAARYERLPIALVHPNPAQPRKFFKADALTALAESIRQVGLLEDILVRPVGDHFEIVLGDRRWRASKIAGLTTIGAKVVDLDDAEVRSIALTENIHREDLTAVEEAFSFKSYIDAGHAIGEIGESFGGMEDRVAERLKLLNTHHYIAYQEQQIEDLSNTVERLQQALTSRRTARYEVVLAAEDELARYLADGFEVAATLSEGRYALRRPAEQGNGASVQGS